MGQNMGHGQKQDRGIDNTLTGFSCPLWAKHPYLLARFGQMSLVFLPDLAQTPTLFAQFHP